MVTGNKGNSCITDAFKEDTPCGRLEFKKTTRRIVSGKLFSIISGK